MTPAADTFYQSPAQPVRPPFLGCRPAQVEAWMARLSPRQRIAQLLHVPSWSNRDQAHQDAVLALIETYGIGGVIFFQGDPAAQVRFTQAYQRASALPLLISLDAEWGAAMRLTGVAPFPYQVALGAVPDLGLLYAMGQEVAYELKALGVHMNHAPSVDLNTEPDNPVIGFRAFGQDPVEVAARARAYMQGMQDAGLLAVAKHFPGHGDTRVDSHLALPVLPHDRARLEAVELRPFRALIEAGVAGVMPAHLRVPALDDRPNIGATLSGPMIQGLLRQQLGFRGLVVTDALDMQGVAAHFSAAEIAARAALAGNDLLLFCVDVPGAIAAIEALVEAGKLTQAEIDERVRRQLMAKAWLGLGDPAAVIPSPPPEPLHRPEGLALRQRLAQEAITLIRDEAARLPLAPGLKVATVVLEAGEAGPEDLAHHSLSGGRAQEGSGALTPFQAALDQAYPATHFRLQPDRLPATRLKGWLDRLQPYDLCILLVQGLAVKARDRFGISDAYQTWLAALTAGLPTVVVHLANPYALRHLPGVNAAGTLLMAYQDLPELQGAAAAVVLGHIPARGKLPVVLD